MDEMRAILDSLMGSDRNNVSSLEKPSRQSFKDRDVCHFYLLDFCPHDLFPNTKSDLGPCPNKHSDSLKEQFLADLDHAYYARKYEREFIDTLQRLIDVVEQRIRKGNERISGPDESQLESDKKKKADQLKQEIALLSSQAQEAGEKGNISEAELFTRKMTEVRCNLDRLNATSLQFISLSSQEKSLRVCEVCGAMQSLGDAASRFESHVSGKQHVGYERIRSTLEALRIKHAAPTLSDEKKRSSSKFRALSESRTEKPKESCVGLEDSSIEGGPVTSIDACSRKPGKSCESRRPCPEEKDRKSRSGCSTSSTRRRHSRNLGRDRSRSRGSKPRRVYDNIYSNNRVRTYRSSRHVTADSPRNYHRYGYEESCSPRDSRRRSPGRLSHRSRERCYSSALYSRYRDKEYRYRSEKESSYRSGRSMKSRSRSRARSSRAKEHIKQRGEDGREEYEGDRRAHTKMRSISNQKNRKSSQHRHHSHRSPRCSRSKSRMSRNPSEHESLGATLEKEMPESQTIKTDCDTREFLMKKLAESKEDDNKTDCKSPSLCAISQNENVLTSIEKLSNKEGSDVKSLETGQEKLEGDRLYI